MRWNLDHSNDPCRIVCRITFQNHRSTFRMLREEYDLVVPRQGQSQSQNLVRQDKIVLQLWLSYLSLCFRDTSKIAPVNPDRQETLLGSTTIIIVFLSSPQKKKKFNILPHVLFSDLGVIGFHFRFWPHHNLFLSPGKYDYRHKFSGFRVNPPLLWRSTTTPYPRHSTIRSFPRANSVARGNLRRTVGP